ncbi:Protein white [Nymphon striatum]|nr:Protein white [Nymphon striatum]
MCDLTASALKNSNLSILKNSEMKDLDDDDTPYSTSGVAISWKNVSLVTKISSGSKSNQSLQLKYILKNLTGVARPGELIAVMGSSGAGKTSFFDCLSGRLKTGEITGTVRLNGHIVSFNELKNVTAYVQQQELFFGTLTVREHLMFHTRLRKRSSETDAKIIVDRIIEELGLTRCSDTKIGITGVIKCLSGGEKRRLALATELLNDLPILLCDEPTTGLDSSMARTIISLLQRIAVTKRKTMIISLHQPSSELFSMFDQEFATTLKNQYFSKDINIDDVTEEKKVCRMVSSILVVVLAKRKGLCTKSCNPCSQTTAENCEFRTNSSIVPKVVAVIVGLCFIGIKVDQHGITASVGALFLFVTENTFPALYGVIQIFPSEFPLVLRENKDGLYRVDAYYFSKILSLIPGFCLDAVIFVTIAYWTVGCMFSAIFRSVPVAMMALVPFDYILMITAGIFIQISSVPAFVGWLKILSWFHYSLEAMSIIQWKDIHNITCEDNVELPCLRNGSQVLSFYGFQQENLHWNLSALAILFAAFHILGFFAFALRTYRT